MPSLAHLECMLYRGRVRTSEWLSSGVLPQGQKLTEKEERQLHYNRQVYELAKLHKQQQDDLDRRDEYHMPTSYDAEGQNQNKRYEVLAARYRSACPAALPSSATPILTYDSWAALAFSRGG